MLSVAGPTIGAMSAIASLAGLPVISAGVTRPSTALSWVGRSSQPSGPLNAVASLATTNATITNLLPMAPCHLSSPSSGVYAGEGLPPVPSKLTEKIRRWEFIEMSEAITGNRRWSQINPSLYSICFTGQAQQTQRCELCFSSTHKTNECSLMADTDPELPSRTKAVEAAVVSLAAQRRQDDTTIRAQPCRLWNMNRCRFPRCRYRHVCSLVEKPTWWSHALITSIRGLMQPELRIARTPLVHFELTQLYKCTIV